MPTDTVSHNKLGDISMVSHIKSSDTLDTSELKSRRTKEQRKQLPILAANDPTLSEITPFNSNAIAK